MSDYKFKSKVKAEGGLNLPAETIQRVPVIDANGDIVSSPVTETELGYLSGVTSSVQDQLDSNADAISDHLADAVDAHDASAISVVPTGNLAADDVQEALVEHQVDIDVVNEELAVLNSTGLLSGAILSVNGDPTKFDLAAGEGYVVDSTDLTAPTKIKVTWSTFTAQTVTNIGTQPVTYILIDSAGAIVQQGLFPTPQQKRSHIFIGRLNHSNLTTIGFADTFPDLLQSPTSQYFDLVDSIGPFSYQGNVITSNGANLSVDKSAGKMYNASFNYANDNQSPNNVLTGNLTLASFIKQSQNANVGGSVTVIDPANYDVAGTVTAVPSTLVTVQRVYLFPSNQVRIQYGQATYVNIAEALSIYESEEFVENPSNTGVAIVIAFLVVRQDATDLSDPAQARIIIAPKFGGSTGAAGAATTNLQQAYDNSVTPEIVTNGVLGALTVKRGSASDTDNVMEVQNGAGSVTASIKGDGTITATNLSGSNTGDQNASQVPSTPAGNLAATNVQDALNELQSDIDTRALDSIVIKKDGSVAFTAAQSMGGFKLTSLAAPSAASDAATKGYVDSALEGLRPKEAVRAASTANIVLATGGLLTIDGVVLVAGDRVLVKDQSAPAENGIYVAAVGAWARSADFDSLSPVDEVNKAYVAVQEGTSHAGKLYVQYGVVTVLGVDAINFTFFNSVSGLIGGDGIAVSGSNISVDHDGEGLTFVATQLALELDGTTLAKSATGLKLNDTAVTPGSFGTATQVSTITVDQQGRLTAASNTLIAIPASQVTDFNEAAQDAVGTILVDSNTIDFTYNDATPSIVADVRTQMSITSDASGIKLVNDETSPGNTEYYGTNASGVKGYYPIPAAGTSPGDIFETTFSAANNQVAAANVTGLAFSAGVVRGFKALVTVTIDATLDLYETFELLGINKNGAFDMAQSATGDSSGIVFTITSAGQVQYTSANYSGFVSASIHFRATTTSV